MTAWVIGHGDVFLNALWQMGNGVLSCEKWRREIKIAIGDEDLKFRVLLY